MPSQLEGCRRRNRDCYAARSCRRGCVQGESSNARIGDPSTGASGKGEEAAHLRRLHQVGSTCTIRLIAVQIDKGNMRAQYRDGCIEVETCLSTSRLLRHKFCVHSVLLRFGLRVHSVLLRFGLRVHSVLLASPESSRAICIVFLHYPATTKPCEGT